MTTRTGAQAVTFKTIDNDSLELSVDPEAATGLIDFTAVSHDEDGDARVAFIQMDTTQIDGIIETLQAMKAAADQA